MKSTSISDYRKQLFDQKYDQAKWLSVDGSSKQHFIIQEQDFSFSICGNLFPSKDVYDPKNITVGCVPYDENKPKCKRCIALVEKRLKEQGDHEA